MSEVFPGGEKAADDNERFGYIAEIVDRAGSPLGMGILIASDRVLTCAHVVNLAMNRATEEPSIPGNDVRIDVQFPFKDGDMRKGSILRWYPPAGKASITDCCVLRLNAPLGIEVQAAQFALGEPGEAFKACRRTGERSPLDWAHGQISELSSDGKVQVRNRKFARGFLIPGCSGGPIISESSEAVLGMVVWANPANETGHITPTHVLQRAHFLRMAGKKTTDWVAIARKLMLIVVLVAAAYFARRIWQSAPDRVFPKEHRASLDVRIDRKRPPKTGWMLIELTNPPKNYGRWTKMSDHIVDEKEDVILPGEGEYFITCSLHSPPIKPKSLQTTANLPPAEKTYGKDIDIKISAKAIEINYSESDIIDTFSKPRG